MGEFKSGNVLSVVFGTCRCIPAPNPLYFVGLGVYSGEKETHSQQKPMVIKVKTVVISRRGIFGWAETQEPSGVLEMVYVLILVMTTQMCT